MTGKTDTDGLWVTQAELARIKGVSRPAIHKRFKRWREAGLIAVDTEGRVRLAEWDTVAAEVTDPSRLVAAELGGTSAGAVDAPAVPTASDSYTRERTRAARYDADLKEMAVARERSQLLEIADVTEAMAICAETLVRDIDRLPGKAEDLATATARQGVEGMREALKGVAREMRARISENMRLLAKGDEATVDPDDADDGRPLSTPVN